MLYIRRTKQGKHGNCNSQTHYPIRIGNGIIPQIQKGCSMDGQISRQEFMDARRRFNSNEDELWLYYIEIQNQLEVIERENF